MAAVNFGKLWLMIPRNPGSLNVLLHERNKGMKQEEFREQDEQNWGKFLDKDDGGSNIKSSHEKMISNQRQIKE